MVPHKCDPEFLSSEYPELWEIVEKERIKQYERMGSDKKTATNYEFNTSESQFLLGQCSINATGLAERLNKNGYDPVIVLGALDFELFLGVKNAKEAVKSDYFHTWVEVDGIITEICTELKDCPGFPLISQFKPRDYVVPKQGGKFKWEEWMDQTNVGTQAKIDEFLERAEQVD